MTPKPPYWTGIQNNQDPRLQTGISIEEYLVPAPGNDIEPRFNRPNGIDRELFDYYQWPYACLTMYPLYSYANYNARQNISETWNPKLVPNRRNQKATVIAYALNNISLTEELEALFKPLPETIVSEQDEEETALASLNLEDDEEPMNEEEQVENDDHISNGEPERRMQLINELETVKPTMDWLDRRYFYEPWPIQCTMNELAHFCVGIQLVMDNIKAKFPQGPNFGGFVNYVDQDEAVQYGMNQLKTLITTQTLGQSLLRFPNATHVSTRRYFMTEIGIWLQGHYVLLPRNRQRMGIPPEDLFRPTAADEAQMNQVHEIELDIVCMSAAVSALSKNG